MDDQLTNKNHISSLSTRIRKCIYIMKILSHSAPNNIFFSSLQDALPIIVNLLSKSVGWGSKNRSH